MLWHSSVVVFLLNLSQLPLPTPSTSFFLSNFLPKSSAKFTLRRFLGALIAHIYGVFGEYEGSSLCCQIHPFEAGFGALFMCTLLLM
jgi:hypothetical protein